MASAGRVLIMPKGNYDSSITYEMLDLVFYDGASWVAKKTVTGIEPSDANSEYWQRMVERIDLAEIEKRLAALEEKEVDLTLYAKQTDVDNLKSKVDTLEEIVNGMS